MHYLCSNQSQRRPRYQPAFTIRCRPAGWPRRLFCLCIASGSGSVLNFSVLRRKGLLVACLDSLGESGEYFIFSVICSQVFLPRYTIFPYKMIPKNDTSTIAWQWLPGLCPTHESWVKFDSTLTQMSRVIVVSDVKTRNMSREFNHADRHLSQSWVNWILLSQSWVTDCSEEKTLRFCIYLSAAVQRKNQPTVTIDRPPPPHPRSTTFGEIIVGITWWVVGKSDLTQLWLKLVESEFSQVTKFGIWVGSVQSQARKVKCWVESESNHPDCHMSQSRVSTKNLCPAQPCWLPILFSFHAFRHSAVLLLK